MAWRSHGDSNKSLVANLRANGLIRTEPVRTAMERVDRKHYVGSSSGSRRDAYMDTPLPIGFNVTISAPHMHAMCLELMELKEGQRVLDVGSGSGYLVACIAILVGSQGMAYGIEHVKELVEQSITNVQEDNPELKNWQILGGDGRFGLKKHAPYDAIHVGAAAEKIPEELLKQLSIGGRLVIPVGPQGGSQDLLLITRDKENDFSQKVVTGVRYVPLTDLKKQV